MKIFLVYYKILNHCKKRLNKIVLTLSKNLLFICLSDQSKFKVLCLFFTASFMLFLATFFTNTNTYCVPTGITVDMDDIEQRLDDLDLNGLERFHEIVYRDFIQRQELPDREIDSNRFSWESFGYFVVGTIALFLISRYSTEILDVLFDRMPNIIIDTVNGTLNFTNVDEFRSHITTITRNLIQTEQGQQTIRRAMEHTTRLIDNTNK